MTVDIQTGGVYLLTDAAGKQITVGGVYLLVDVNTLTPTPIRVGGLYLLVDADLDDISADGTAVSSGVAALSGRDFFMDLTITDGTTTANLVDGINYALVDGGWGPSVAALRQSTLGWGPYNDVIEQLTIDVFGTTGAVCLANLARLSQLLDQAERWYRGEPVEPVLLTCSPQGSELGDTLSCVILGRAGESAVNPPATFNDFLMIYEIPNVQLSFRRRGLWLAAAEAAGTSALAAVGTVQTVQFASAAAISSPLSADLSLQLAPDDFAGGYLLIANAANKLWLLEAEDFSIVTPPGSPPPAYPWSVVTGATKCASGGQLLEFEPVDTGMYELNYDLIGWSNAAKRIGVFVVLSGVTSDAFQIKATFLCLWNGRLVGTPEATIVSTATDPQVVFLGYVTAPGASYLILSLTALGVPSSGPVAALDCVALIAMDDETSSVLAVQPSPNAAILGYPTEIRTSPGALTAVTPSVFNGTALLPYLGDAWTATQGDTVAACLLATMNSFWRLNVSGTAIQTQLSASRWLGYLTPQ